MAGGFWIRFGDTDPYGVVYYSSYHKYAHQTLEDFLREKGIEPDTFFRNPSEGYGMPVVVSQGRFLKPVRYPAYIIPHVEVERVGESSISFRVEFYKERTLVAEVKLTLVCIDSSWNKRKLPKEIKRLFSGGTR